MSASPCAPTRCAFLRGDLMRRRIQTCAEATATRDGALVAVAGLVLIRQRPGSAKGVMFITIEDESGIANIVVWPDLFERERRTILAASLLGVEGRIQREGEVVHVVAHRLGNLAGLLASVAGRDAGCRMPEQAETSYSRPPSGLSGEPGAAGDPPALTAPLPETIRVKTRDFR